MTKHSTTIPRQTSPVHRAAERTETSSLPAHGRHCGCWPCLRAAVPFLAVLDDTEAHVAAVQDELRADATATVTQ